MTIQSQDDIAALNSVEFARLARLIEERAGINLPPHKKNLMSHRLSKRLKALHLNNYHEYMDFIFEEKNKDDEMEYFINALTTNKTEFFREPKHFDVLSEMVLPRLASHRAYTSSNPLTVWSAACSAGMEVYTLAMVLSQWSQKAGNIPFSILGTDIDTDVLHEAVRAVYHQDYIAPVSQALRAKYLLRAKDPKKQTVRIAPELRKRVHFSQMNLLDGGAPVEREIDIVFCRNVLIYFNRDIQKKVLDGLCRHLVPGGYLFVSHSETLTGLALPLRSVAPSVYVRLGKGG